MKIGIIGLPQSGKKTLFKTLTQIETLPVVKAGEAMMGMAALRDSRFDKLVDMYAPEKIAPAKITYAVLPKLEKETLREGKIFIQISDVDVVCLVVSDFHDESIYHVDGSIDAKRDIANISSELILHDLLFVEKRTQRLKLNLKKIKNKTEQNELELMEKMKICLEEDKPLRSMTIDEESRVLISGYPLITFKEMIVVLNTDDARSHDNKEEEHKALCESLLVDLMPISAQIESEIASLDSVQEQQEFLEELGITEPAIERFTLLCLKKLGYISFFTVGKDEVRQWLLRNGSLAPQAAGVIHSDLERGFIRAELMKYDELMQYKTEAALKDVGKQHLKGKDYLVCDGDIMNILFKV
jgi:ribosome-binding ATPase